VCYVRQPAREEAAMRSVPEVRLLRRECIPWKRMHERPGGPAAESASESERDDAVGLTSDRDDRSEPREPGKQVSVAHLDNREV